MQFNDLDLHNQLQKSLALQKYSELTKVQELAITKAMLGHDLIVASKTGSGKTLAFAVPVINQLLSNKALSKQDSRALIIAPTRELAKQVFSVFKKLIQGTRLSCALIVGGENFNDQLKKLRKNPEIIVATAGRLADHLAAKHVFLNGLEMLVFDEADRMLELGFAEALALINKQADHRKRQTLWFSATLDSPRVAQFTPQFLKSPTRLEIDKVEQPHEDITQCFYFSDNVEHKDAQINALISKETRKQTILFTATRADTQRICDDLNKLGFSSGYLHGELTQGKRNQVVSDFIHNKIGVLVTTDLASRGLDIPNIAQVINYDLPLLADEYVHRIGRTGRAGQKGSAISLVGKRDWWSFINIKARLAINLEVTNLPALPAKFSGIQNNPGKSSDQRLKAKTNKHTKKINKAPKTKEQSTTTKTSVEAGHLPIRRKKENGD